MSQLRPRIMPFTAVFLGSRHLGNASPASEWPTSWVHLGAQGGPARQNLACEHSHALGLLYQGREDVHTQVQLSTYPRHYRGKVRLLIKLTHRMATGPFRHINQYEECTTTDR